MAVSGRKGHIVCEPCAEVGDDITADGCCKECEENMCSKCFQHHRKGKHCRNHVFLYAEYSGTPSALNIKPVGLIDKCPKHVQEKINFYCEAHEIVGCGECIIHEHKTCEVLYISDVTRGQNHNEYIEEVVKEIENCSNEIKEYEKEIHQNIYKMKATHVKFTCDAEEFKQEILETIDKLIFDACKHASFIKTDALNALGKLKVEVSKVTDELSSMKTKADIEKNEPTGNFVTALWLRKRLKEIEEDLIEIGKRTIVTKYRFLKNENIEQEVEKCKGRDLFRRSQDAEQDNNGIRNLRTVTLEKASGVLGFRIDGGIDGQPLFVGEIIPGTPAANSNKILIGDKIISINNVDVTSQLEAAALIKQYEKTILVLCRPEDDELDKYGIRNPRTVILETASGVVGLSIKRGDDKQSLFVSKIIPGTPAANSNKILLGDKIISINNIDVTKSFHHEAVPLIKKCEKTILVLCRPEVTGKRQDARNQEDTSEQDLD